MTGVLSCGTVPRSVYPSGDVPTIAGVSVPPQHREFARRVEASRAIDPMPTFRTLSAETGIAADDLVHHALVRWVSAGSEALLAIEPPVLRELIDARRAGDWEKVGGIIDWLEAGL
jgi:hypothetical protein